MHTETESIRQKQTRENQTGLELERETDSQHRLILNQIRRLEETLGIILSSVPKMLSYSFSIYFYLIVKVKYIVSTF